MVEKIKKLLALAADQEGKPEGDLAADLALKLMKEHALELGDLEEPSEIDSRVVDGNQSHWRHALIDIVARHCQCFAIRTEGKMLVYGYPVDLDVCLYLIDLYTAQLISEGLHYVDALPPYFDDWARANTTDRFLRNAVYTLKKRLQKLRASKQAAPGTQLVLHRASVVAQHVADMHYLGESTLDLLGTSVAGRDAGNRVRLGIQKEIN